MSKKMQIPDELLDMVAGGRVVIDGEIVTQLFLDSDSVLALTKKGTYSLKKDCKYDMELKKMLPDLMNHEHDIEVTPYFKKGL